MNSHVKLASAADLAAARLDRQAVFKPPMRGWALAHAFVDAVVKNLQHPRAEAVIKTAEGMKV